MSTTACTYRFILGQKGTSCTPLITQCQDRATERRTFFLNDTGKLLHDQGYGMNHIIQSFLPVDSSRPWCEKFVSFSVPFFQPVLIITPVLRLILKSPKNCTTSGGFRQIRRYRTVCFYLTRCISCDSPAADVGVNSPSLFGLSSKIPLTFTVSRLTMNNSLLLPDSSCSSSSGPCRRRV